MMKRVAALILTLMLLLAAVSATAETTAVHAVFPDMQRNTVTIDVPFDESVFLAESDHYDHTLARMSLGMAVSAFRSNSDVIETSDTNIRSFFAEAGFENVTVNGFSEAGREDTLATAIASKTIMDGGEEILLVAVAICGQGYGNEWLSNFTVGDDVVHTGFHSAMRIAKNRVDQYLERFGAGKRIKLWVSGYSRSAAVSNLLGAEFIRTGTAFAKDIYVYTFATPNCTKDPVDYPQIYNIVGAFDPVPQVPLNAWGFSKHGTTLYVSSPEVNSSHASVQERMDAYYSTYCHDLQEELTPNRNWFLSTLLNLMTRFMPEAKDYTAGVQAALKTAWVSDNAGDGLTALMNALPEIENVSDSSRNELMALISQSAMAGIEDIVENRNTGWTNLLTSGKQLAFEHFPMRYVSALYAVDDPAELYEHADSWVYVSIEQDADYYVFNRDTVEEYVPSEVVIGGKTVLAIPRDNEYVFTLLGKHESFINMEFRIGKLGSTMFEQLSTNIHIAKGEAAVVYLPVDGDPYVEVSNGDIPVVLEDADMTAFVDSQATVLTRVFAAGSLYIPRTLYFVMLILDFLCVSLWKLLHPHRHNHRFRCALIWKWALRLCALGCAIQSGRYLYGLIVLLKQNRVTTLSMEALAKASTMIQLSRTVWQLLCVLIYAILCSLCLRAVGHGLTRDRCARAALGMLLTDVLRILLCKLFGSPIVWTYWASLALPGAILVILIFQGFTIREE